MPDNQANFTALTPRPPEDIQNGVDQLTAALTAYLETLGLPSERATRYTKFLE